MGRLCERPECSEPGEIAYGFDTALLLVWMRSLTAEDDRHRAGVLCVRHADAMVVPRGWALDDSREDVPRLFRPEAAAQPRPQQATVTALADKQAARRKRPPKRSAPALDDRQLHFEPVPEPLPQADDTAAMTISAVTGVSSKAEPDATEAIPWKPEFDADDDLDGTLDADTPLLARAFRGTDRPAR